jgi:hypothetical protein
VSRGALIVLGIVLAGVIALLWLGYFLAEPRTSSTVYTLF